MTDQQFKEILMQNGILSYSKQESLLDIAKRCAMTAGVPLAGAGAVGMAGAGSVFVPGVGAIPGFVAGLLAGMVSGTVICTMLNTSHREALRSFADSL